MILWFYDPRVTLPGNSRAVPEHSSELFTSPCLRELAPRPYSRPGLSSSSPWRYLRQPYASLTVPRAALTCTSRPRFFHVLLIHFVAPTQLSSRSKSSSPQTQRQGCNVTPAPPRLGTLTAGAQPEQPVSSQEGGTDLCSQRSETDSQRHELISPSQLSLTIFPAAPEPDQ